MHDNIWVWVCATTAINLTLSPHTIRATVQLRDFYKSPKKVLRPIFPFFFEKGKKFRKFLAFLKSAGLKQIFPFFFKRKKFSPFFFSSKQIFPFLFKKGKIFPFFFKRPKFSPFQKGEKSGNF